jgi:DNA-binding SARP family transcriptional activator
MLQRTIVIIDYDTQELSRVLDLLVGIHDVFVVAYNRLPDIPIRISRVLALVLLCTKPDDEVAQSLQTLRFCYSDLKIIVMSPEPTPFMVAQAITFGANDYINLATDDVKIMESFRRYNQTPTINPPIWKRILGWLQPRRALSIPSTAQKLANIEPLVSAMSDKWIGGKDSTTPQYNDLIEVQLLLLAYLLYNHNRPIHKEILMSMFWGDNVNDAKNCLNVAIFSLRKALSKLTDEKTIIFLNDYYAINTEFWRIETDADAFSRLWEKSRSSLRTHGLEAAIDDLKNLKMMYRDDFLPNFNHEWAIGRRDEFREKHLQALNLLSEHYWKNQRLSDCIDSCCDILKVDDCVELTHRRLMQCYLTLKMKGKAVRQYKRCRESLKKLNIAPETETENLYLSILQS